MNLQGRDLKLDLSGDDVRLLHSELAQLGLAVPDAERLRAFFGPGTRDAVINFQTAKRLPITGVVDAATASAINQEVDATTSTVVGTVTSPSGKPLAGLVVRASDVDLRSEQSLGEVVTDEAGHYEIRYRPQQFLRAEKGSADLAVRVYNVQGQLLYEPGLDKVLFNAPPIAVIDIQLDTGDQPVESEFEKILADLRPLLVEIPIADLREDDQTHDITFLFRETGWSVDRLEHMVVSFRLKNRAEIRPDFFYALLRENTLLKVDLASAWQTHFEINLQSDVQAVFYQIVLLDPQTVRTAVQDAIAQALVPGDLAKELDGILRQLAGCTQAAQDYLHNEQPRRILNTIGDTLVSGRAAEALDIIRQAGPGDLTGLVERLQQAALLVNQSDGANVQTRLDLGALLVYDQDLIDSVGQAQGIEDPAQVRNLAAMNRADWKKVLSQSAAQLRAGGEPIAPEMVDLHASALVRKMEARFPTTAFAAQLKRDTSSPLPNREAITALLDQHPEFDLATTNIDAFFLKAGQDGTPGEAAAANHQPAADKQPADGNGAVDASAPSEAVKNTLKQVQRVFKLVPNYTKTSALLNAGIGSAHDIYSMGKDRFVRTFTASGTFTPQEAPAVFNKASNVHLASTMLAAELRSAATASEVHALSSALTAEKLNLVVKDFPNLKSLFELTDLCQCDDCRSISSPAAYLVDVFQFLKNRLVIDTTGATPVTLKQARDVLFERRPDLGDLDLSCDNTNTPLPYIDLVCEVLEEAVSPDPGLAFSGTIAAGAVPAALASLLETNQVHLSDEAAIYDPDAQGNFILRDTAVVFKIIPNGPGNWTLKRLHQTDLSTEELMAAPEYLNEAAYTTLASSQVAFHLPFDLFHQESRGYFDQFGIQRSDLMTALQKGGTPQDFEIAADALGFTDEERALIVTPDAANQAVYWNTGANPVVDTMQVVDTFLTRSELTYQQLVDLLRLPFIDQAGNLFIQHLDSTCDTTQQVIKNLDADALDRMHRFLRFWRGSGWSMAAVDAAINAPRLGNGVLDNAFLVDAAWLVQLKAALGLPVEELNIFYGVIPQNGNPSRYAQLFLNKAANGSIDETFLPKNVQANETAATPVKLVDVSDTLAISLGVTPADLDLLIDLLGALKGISPASQAMLSFANLAGLYALALLGKKLGLKIAELQDMQGMTGVDPLKSPADTLQFVKKVRKLQVAGRKVADLKFFLRQEADDLPARVMKEASITALLTGLQKAYQAAFAADRSPYDDTLTADENQAPVKDLLARLPNFTDVDLNKFAALLQGNWTDPSLTADAYIDAMLGGILDAATLTNLKNLQDALAAALPVDVEKDRKDLIQAVLDALSTYFFQANQQNALQQTMMSAFKTGDELTRVLLRSARLKASTGPGKGKSLLDLLTGGVPVDTTNTPPAPPAITPAAFPDLYGAVRLFGKMVPFINPLSLTTDVVEWLLLHAHDLGWLELDAVPYDATTTAAAVDFGPWETFQDAINLMQEFPPVNNPDDLGHPLSVTMLFDRVLDPSSSAGDSLSLLARLAGWDPTVVTALDTYFGLSTPNLDAYKLPATYQQLEKAVVLLRKLGLDLTTGLSLVNPKLTYANAKTLRLALKVRYDDADWLPVLKGIQDGLRDKKRDALVAYLLAANPDFTSSDDLLIEVELDACQPTSRIVQAHGTVQLFAQRCLMGLEPRAVADVTEDHAWDQWKWMANYRVWEANRKVFLYPENWIAPELRDDKSFLFKDLETELLQNELNALNAETATIHYLEKLDEIARLEVVAVYYQTDIYTMHVFARTKGGDPAAYYYRRFENEKSWTPWEKVDLDIASDHLMAFVRNDRLYLAWPIFNEDPNQDQNITIPNGSTDAGKPVEKSQKRWKVQLATSEYAGSKWLPKKVAKDPLYTQNNYEILPAKEDFRFTLLDLGKKGYYVICTYLENGKLPGGSWNPDSTTVPQGYLGTYLLTGCKGYPEVPTRPIPLPRMAFVPLFRDTAFKNLRYKEMDKDATDDLSERTIFLLSNFLTLVNNTPGTFYITYPQQMSLIDQIILLLEILALGKSQSQLYASYRERQLVVPLGTFMPYFYDDDDRNYVIVPGFYSSPVIITLGVDQPAMVKANGNANTDLDKTFSDILQFVEDVVALLKKYWKIWQANPSVDPKQIIAQMLKDPEYIRLSKELELFRSLQPGVKFKNFYHPLVCSLRTAVNRDGIPGLLTRDVQMQQTSFDFTAKDMYDPTTVVIPPYPVEDIDFTLDGSYSKFNMELFFHLPFRVAMQLSNDQRFEEAQQWFHYIFNPTGALKGDAPGKYWVTKPFFQYQSGDYMSQRIDTLLYDIALDPSGATIEDLKFAVEEWRDNPFKPDVIARSRPVAYQKAIVINYIKNLVAWGDYLFQQDTMESVNQATQMYVLADKLLGPKPRIIPPLIEPVPDTYWQLEAKVDLFGNALLDLENLIPDLNLLPEHGAELPPAPLTYSSLYFCIPQNDNLLKIWDTVADRLYKIRHCQNYEGVERILALFSPPIDPGALVRAAAAGLDISAIISGMNAPRPFYRFTTMTQKALELAQEVRTLGSSLLAALEKRDGEGLALLRSTQEQRVLEAVKILKQQQINEAVETVNGLNLSKAVIQERKNFYQTQQYMNMWETLAVSLSSASLAIDAGIALGYVLAGGLKLIPQFLLGAAGFGGTPTAEVDTGGHSFGDSAADLVQSLNAIATSLEKSASLASQQASFQRRQDEWDFQGRLADDELAQMDSQITAATIRQTIATQDLLNQQIQIDNAKAADMYMRSKFTNQDLYDWTVGQISGVYFQAYKLALQAARKAERCFNHELATSAMFIQPGYWDNLKKGLQSADQLVYDIKRMEAAYLDQNRREYELTKHISLAALDPLALLQLKNTGKCTVSLPEVIFAVDHPELYRLRAKYVSITIPCVAGPYTTVSCKLSLLSSKYRKDTSLNPTGGTDKEKYVEVAGNDPRFVYNVGSPQSIVTSSAQNDSGMFELNFRDERYLPFEGAGAISTWQLELPSAFKQVDPDTISDVILHVYYTALDGGTSFKTLVESVLYQLMNEMIVEASQTGLFKIINIQHEFPSAWNSLSTGGSTPLTIATQQLPFFVKGHGPAISSAVWVAQMKKSTSAFTLIQDGSAITLNADPKMKNVLKGSVPALALDTALTLSATAVGDVEDLYLILNYTLSS